MEEDPSLSFEQNQDTHQFLMWGQGEIHLRVAQEKLRNRYNLDVAVERPLNPYKETIRKPVKQQGRHKKQTGGHGQFGDVHIGRIDAQLHAAAFLDEDHHPSPFMAAECDLLKP